MNIGYARVSTRDQDLSLQRAALEEADCEKIFEEKGSGEDSGRPEFAKALEWCREGANLDLSWIRDKSLEDSADLEDPDLIAEEIADDLQAALEQFVTIASDLGGRRNGATL